jgi:hypothetical protein
MPDKRKDVRKKIMAFTPVYTMHPKTLIGYLEDLTIHGARVVGNVLLEAGKLVTLSIEFPAGTPDVPPGPFVAQARVTRAHADEMNYENLGFEFADLAEEQVNVLEAVIHRYEFRRVN